MKTDVASQRDAAEIRLMQAFDRTGEPDDAFSP